VFECGTGLLEYGTGLLECGTGLLGYGTGLLERGRCREQERAMRPQSLPRASRERILEAFAEGARVDGPRSVVMAELARDLGISTRTLYQHFPSKAELVASLMDGWADQVEREQRANLAEESSPYERMLRAANHWLEGQCRFSTTFWLQLDRDFPEVSRGFQERLRAILQEGREALVEFIREDIDKGLALSLMNASLAAAADPARCDRLGISRQDAVRQAIEVWVRGTLRPLRALHAVRNPK